MGATRFPAIDRVILIFQQRIVGPEESLDLIRVKLLLFKLCKGWTRFVVC